jgi:hypothetical protein
MSDEPKKGKRAWIGWALLAMLFLYPLSYIPVCLLGVWSVELGVFSNETVLKSLATIYAPVLWVMGKRHAAEADAFDPLVPSADR